MQHTQAPILVVEDIPNILEFLEMTLRFKGYRVIAARNGEEALRGAAEDLPALVITDILMPKMDGYTLAFNLRREERTSHVPIIFLSATYVTPEDKNFAMSLGAVRFLEKPVDTEEFLITVAEVLTNSDASLTPPMEKRQFLSGYRRRLEVKLQHKNSQILRTQRLLENLPEEQKTAFADLLSEARQQKNEIHAELDEIYHELETHQNLAQA
jgi:DNA-binding response OmpR family regulator